MSPHEFSVIAEALPDGADVVVIGAGITGICTSLFLATRGVEVVVAERGMPWAEGSGVNAGTLTVQGEYVDTIPLTRFSVALWDEFGAARGIDVGFKRIGGLRVATTEAEVAALRAATEERRTKCHLELEWLEGKTLRGCAPWLGAGVTAASLCVEDALSSPLVAGLSLTKAAAAAGVQIVANAPVSAIRREAKNWVTETSRGSIRTESVVIAAGPWSSEIMRMLGADLPTYVDIDMLTVTEPCPPLFDRVVTHAAGILSLKQFPNGSVVIGGGWQGKGSFAAKEKQLHYTRLLQNLAVAAEIIPGLARLRVLRSWAGYEGVAPDGMPVVGSVPSAPNAYVAAIARGGYTHGPALGLLIAELILEGRTRIPIDRFAPERLAQFVEPEPMNAQ